MSTPQPGWYPNPDGTGGERWWSGTGWTVHTRGGAAPSPAPQPPEHPAAAGEPAGGGRSPWLVLAIVAVVLLVGVVAVLVVTGRNDGDDEMTRSEAYCSDLRSGLTPLNLWDREQDPAQYADIVYGFVAISCPEQFDENEQLRIFLENNGIEPEAP